MSVCPAIHLSLRFVDTLTWSFLLDTFKMLYMDCLIQTLTKIRICVLSDKQWTRWLTKWPLHAGLHLWTLLLSNLCLEILKTFIKLWPKLGYRFYPMNDNQDGWKIAATWGQFGLVNTLTLTFLTWFPPHSIYRLLAWNACPSLNITKMATKMPVGLHFWSF